MLPPAKHSSDASTSRTPTDHALVYFSACVSRMMGGDVLQTLTKVAQNAGFTVYPVSAGACCGQAFSSKGYTEAARHTHNTVIETLWRLSDKGRYPVVMDVSSCTQTLRACRPWLNEQNQRYFDQLRLLDSIEFLHDLALPRLQITTPLAQIVLHPVCSLQKMKLSEKNLALARACAREVLVPDGAGCCGMAGDRGFFVPELSRSALQEEAAGVLAIGKSAGYFASACTCESALSAATGQSYRSMAHLVQLATVAPTVV